jgi:hypothetical protein
MINLNSTLNPKQNGVMSKNQQGLELNKMGMTSLS